MRNLQHYLNLFASSETVGRELVARAIYAGRYGDADNPNVDVLRDLTRELPETLTREEATEIARGSSAWRDFLDHDPIPAWALRLGIQAAGFTQAQFAEQIATSERTVRYWLAGERNCSGPTAIAVRMVLTDP